jgi:hypothetical protein
MAALVAYFLCLVIPHTYLHYKLKLKSSIFINIALSFIVFLIIIFLPLNKCDYNCAGEAVGLFYLINVGILVFLIIFNSIFIKIDEYIVKKKFIKS